MWRKLGSLFVCWSLFKQDMEKMPDDSSWVRAELDNSQVRLRTKESTGCEINTKRALYLIFFLLH